MFTVQLTIVYPDFENEGTNSEKPALDIEKTLQIKARAEKSTSKYTSLNAMFVRRNLSNYQL